MKKTKFPRQSILDRQQANATKILELDRQTLYSVRGGDARYGLPKTKDCALE